MYLPQLIESLQSRLCSCLIVSIFGQDGVSVGRYSSHLNKEQVPFLVFVDQYSPQSLPFHPAKNLEAKTNQAMEFACGGGRISLLW
jgi:hypothetical protein